MIDQVERTTDIVILMFYFAREVRGVTKVQKILYLMEKETEFYEAYKDKLTDELDFKAYNMGPFSENVYDELEFLINIGALEKDSMELDAADSYEVKSFEEREEALGASNELSNKVFKITDKGDKIGEKLVQVLEDEYVEEIKELTRKYNKKSLSNVLEYVYTAYPDSARNSKIRDEVLKQ